MVITHKSVDAIIFFEVSSKAYYEKFLRQPTYPGGSSGVTIGIGYDLGYNSNDSIQKDWQGFVSQSMIDLMKSVAGVKGALAKNVLRSVAAISIPFDSAKSVFVSRVIKNEAKNTLDAFPGIDALYPDAQGGLLSLVYNRGEGMSDHDVKSHDRAEMRAIRALVPTKDYVGIHNQILSMKRLWDGTPDYPGDKEQKFSGLLNRRDIEADLVLNSNRTYDDSELIKL